jgi:hypothetical protein
MNNRVVHCSPMNSPVIQQKNKNSKEVEKKRVSE